MKKYYRDNPDGTRTEVTEAEYLWENSRAYRIGWHVGQAIPGIGIGAFLGSLVVIADRILR